MPTLKFNTHFPPAQARTIRLALESGLISDKAQARVEGIAPGSITDRWDAIATRLHLRYGQRQRAHVLIALVRNKHIEYLMIALALALGAGLIGGDIIRSTRIPRPAAQTQRAGRRPQPLSLTDELLLDWSLA